jgi:hypothetical protein
MNCGFCIQIFTACPNSSAEGGLNSEAGIFASKRNAYSPHCHQLAKMVAGGEVLNAKLFRNSFEADPVLAGGLRGRPDRI